MTIWRVLKVVFWLELTQAAIGISAGAVYPYLVHWHIISDRLHILPKWVGEDFPKNDRAVVAIEFAIIAPVMFMLLGVVFFAGVGFYSQSSLTFATQQAALASVAGQGANAQTVFNSNIPVTISGATVQCAAGTGTTTCNGAGTLQVPFAGLFNANSTINLAATATAAQPAGQ